MTHRVCLLIALRRLRKNNYATHNPGMGQDHTCNTEFVWPIPGLFSALRRHRYFFGTALDALSSMKCKRGHAMFNLYFRSGSGKAIQKHGIGAGNFAMNSKLQAANNTHTQTLNPADPLEAIPILE
jgi:hypothetical protein